MKSLNKQATKIFTQITMGLTKIGDHAKIGEDGRAFMAVCVDVIDMPAVLDWPPQSSAVIAIAHYFKQHGDMCCDPDMTFLAYQPTDRSPLQVFPMTFQQALPPCYDVGIELAGGKLLLRRKLQADMTRFANMWMKNIKAQQDLPAYVKSCALTKTPRVAV